MYFLLLGDFQEFLQDFEALEYHLKSLDHLLCSLVRASMILCLLKEYNSEWLATNFKNQSREVSYDFHLVEGCFETFIEILLQQMYHLRYQKEKMM